MIKLIHNKRLILIILLLVISLGYALLNATLTINGNNKINAQSWDIHWNNVQVSGGSVAIDTNDQAATITSGDTTEVTYEVTLDMPGDFYEFTVDAVNGGTIDAMIDVITSTYKIGNGEVTTITSNNLPDYLEYSVTYSDGLTLSRYQELKANTTETYKVRVAYKRDIDEDDLPETNQSIIFSFAVDYVQADSNATAVQHGFTGTKYTTNIYDDNEETWLNGTNNSMVWIGRTITNNITQYDNAQDAMNALKLASGNVDRPFYLKHTIVNDVVTESYVEFIVTDDMATTNEGMVAGTYTLRGAGGTNCVFDNNQYQWTCDSYSPYYESNVNTIKTAFGYSTHPERCSTYGQAEDGSLRFDCNVARLDAYSILGGNVVARDGSWGCGVSEDGAAGCDD